MKLAAIYWLDIDDADSPYKKMLLNSVWSLRKHDQEIEIIVATPKKFDFPYEKFRINFVRQADSVRKLDQSLSKKYGKYSILDLDLKNYDRVIFMDVDTLIKTNLTGLILKYQELDFAARKISGDYDQIVKNANQSFQKFGFKIVYRGQKKNTDLYYTTGVFVLNPKYAGLIKNNFLAEIGKKMDNPFFITNLKTGEVKAVEEFIEEYKFTQAVIKANIKIGELAPTDNMVYPFEGYRRANIFHISSNFYRPIMAKPFWRWRFILGLN